MRLPKIKFKYGSDKPTKQPFRLLEENNRNITWGGVLPHAPVSNHFLYTINTNLPDNFGVYLPKRFSTATHEIKFGYRLAVGSKPLCILYTAQYDFSGQKRIPQWFASKITKAIAQKLLDPKTEINLLLRTDPGYWDWFIESKFKTLKYYLAMSDD